MSAQSPVCSAVDLLRHRWLLHLLRCLRSQPQRFTGLVAALSRDGRPVHPKSVSATMRYLQTNGLAERSHRTTGTPFGGEAVYSITSLGRELLGLLEALDTFIAAHRPQFAPRADDPRSSP